MESLDPLMNDPEALRARLEEALEALEAIRTGGIDALVVYSDDGEQVYTLQGADHPYRLMVEMMNEGAATLSEDGVVIYANSCLAGMLETPLENVLGATLIQAVSESDRPAFEAILAQGRQENCKTEVRLQSGNGSQVPVLLSLSPLETPDVKGVCLTVTDLTEQKRNEAILAAERMARSIIDQAAETIIVCDTNGKIIRASRSAHQLAGQNPLFKPFENIFPLHFSTSSDNRFSLPAVLGGTVFQGCQGSLEFQEEENDSERRFSLLLSATPLTGDQEQVLGCVITMTDVTEQEKAEQALIQANTRLREAMTALEESEERLSLALQAMESGIYDWDIQNNTETWSPEMHHLFGIAQDQPAEFETRFDRVHPEDQEHLRQSVAEAQQGQEFWQEEYRIRHPDLGIRWIESFGKILYDEDGNPLRMTGISFDVTERKIMQERLTYHARLLENVHDAVIATDVDSRITAWNKAAEVMYGWTEEEVIGRNLNSLLHAKYTPDQRDSAVQQSEEKGYFSGEMVQYTKDGREIIVEGAFISLRDPDDNITGYITANRDITERKQAEEALQQINAELEQRVIRRTRQLEALNRELRQEIAERKQIEADLAELQRWMMDRIEAERIDLARELHDGPMQELYGVIYGLAAAAGGPMEEEIKDQLNLIQQQIILVNHTLRNISRDLRPPTLTQYGLEKAIREHIHRLERSKKKLKIEMELTPDEQSLPESVRLALFRIYQVAVTNVIRHAEASRLTIQFFFNDQQVSLSIEDNGSGFQVPERWVDFARQGHLGLVGAMERAQAIGGQMEVQSSPGEGTRIQVAVPLETVLEQEAAPSA